LCNYLYVYNFGGEMIKDYRLSKASLMPLTGQLAALCTGDEVYKVNVKPWSKSLEDRQRALANIWYADIEKQLGETAGYAAAYCKYHFGLRVRCRDDEELGVIVRRMLAMKSYEQKLATIRNYSEWFPVLRAKGGLDAEGQAEYLQAIQLHFAEQGIILTTPKDKDLLFCREANK
jgi:hypothetical protein